MDENINILVLNDISRNVIRYLAKNLSSIFGTDVKLSRHLVIPTTLFNEDKGQYDGRKLLKFLTENMTLKEVKAVNLALFDRDLFIGSLDYAFGLASPFPKISVISILRLHPHFQKDYFTGGLKKRKAGRFPLFVRRLSSQEKTLYYDRILKEAIHGIGHTMGLIHCRRKECIMHQSDAISDIDSKETGFCKSCRDLL
jgi:archaemetzincin